MFSWMQDNLYKWCIVLLAGDYLDSGVGSDPDRECRDVCEDESDTENGGSPPGARKTPDPPIMNGESVSCYLWCL
jgi:hypothetical protein